MTAIIIEDLWKSYQRGRTRLGSLRNSASYFWKSLGQRREEFDALAGINLTMAEGEILGIIGPNGAGKSTLLKVLSRVTFPTKGKIVLRGRCSSMLEVGVGFHPELTGRDNIYLSGTIHGMRKREINAQFDSIVAFSGQEASLDTPVKHYSSGMMMRLAFAVSAHLDPDILIMDEVLAVGDQEFRTQCIGKIRELLAQGKTILLVSHQLDYLVELCTRGICMQQGKIVHEGSMQEVIEQYVDSEAVHHMASILDRRDRTGSRDAQIVKIQMCDAGGKEILYGSSGQSVMIRFFISSSLSELKDLAIRLNCFDAMGRQWFVINSKISDGLFPSVPGEAVMTCHIPRLPLRPGHYNFSVSLSCNHQVSDALTNALEMNVVEGLFYKTGMLPQDKEGILVDYEWNLEP